MEVGIFKAKSNLSKLVEAALAGELVTLTHHGKPVANIVPIEKPSYKKHLEEHPAFGMLQEEQKTVPQIMQELRKPRF
ncbi:MAG: type II toxin-antitoxin system prevent-host-death family antitoxin [Verrucomicrobiota bacterium]